MDEGIPSASELLPESLGDPSDQILERARTDAYQALHDINKSPMQKAKAAPASPAPSQQAQDDSAIPSQPQRISRPPDPTAGQPRGFDPALDAVDVIQAKSEDAPEQAVDIPKPTKTHSSVSDFIRDLSQGLGTEIANFAPRVEAKFGGFITKGLAGLASIGDMGLNKAHEAIADASDLATFIKSRGAIRMKNNDTEPYHMADAVFDFKKKYIDDAIEHWTPKRAAQTGEEGSSPLASAVGGGLEVAPNMAMGPGGLLEIVADSGTTSTMEQIDSGHKLSTAVANGTLDAISNYVQAKIGVVPSLPVLKRILASMAIGDVLHVSSQVLKKIVLAQTGYEEEAHKMDVTADLGPATITNAVFGAAGGQKVEGKAPPANAQDVPQVDRAPAEEANPVINPTPRAPAATPAQDALAAFQEKYANAGIKSGTPLADHFDRLIAAAEKEKNSQAPAAQQPKSVEPTPPAVAPLTSAPSNEGAGAATAGPAQRSLVPDMPSAESSKDLAAQFADAADKKTPRTGVLVSKPSMEALKTDVTGDGAAVKGVIKAAQASGRLVKTPNGDILVMPTAEAALKAKTELASGSDPQAVIGRITGAGTGKAPDQTVVVQGHTPEGAVAKESMVTPAEAPAKIDEMVAEGKKPVVTTPEGALARRTQTVAEAKKPPVMGVAEVGKKELPVHIEEGAPEGMTRVRPLDESGEPGAMTHDVPSERVRTGSEKPVEKPKPVKESAPEQPKPVAEAKPTEAEPPLAEALRQHEAQEEAPAGKAFPARLKERQDNTASFAGALKAAANGAKGKVDDALVARAAKAAAAGEGMSAKSEEATSKGQGTGHARISAINEEMHKAARLLMGRGEKGDEVPAVAPKAAALKARVARAAKPKVEPKVTSASKQAEAEVRAKYPGLENIEENVLAKRMLKRRTAEIEAENAKAKSAKAAEMVEAPVHAEAPKTVTDEQLRKARNKAKVDEAQAQMSGHPEHAKAAQKSAEEYAALKRTHDIEHGVAIEPDQPKTVGERLKVKEAGKQHDKLVEDYVNATEAELPEAFDKIVASAERLVGRKMSDSEIADAKRIMDNQREVAKLTQEQEADSDAAKMFEQHADSPLSKEWSSFHKLLNSNGFYRELERVQQSGGAVSGHVVLDRMIASAGNHPVVLGMLQALRAHAPDIVVRPQNEITNPFTGESDPSWAGMYTPRLKLLQARVRRPDTLRTMVHEFTHAGTSEFIVKNPDHPLVKQLESQMQEFIDRLRAQSPEWARKVDASLGHYRNKGPKTDDVDRRLYGLTNAREFAAEVMGNHELASLVAKVDPGKPNILSAPKNGLLSKIWRTIGEMLGMNPHESSLLARVLDTTGELLKAQKGMADAYGMNSGSEVYYRSLPPEVRGMFKNDAALTYLTPEEKESLLSISEDPPKLPHGDSDLSHIVSDETMDRIRSFSHLAREGTFRAVRNAKMAFTSADQLMRRFRGDFGHVDDPKNPLTELEAATDGKAKIRHEMEDKAAPIAEARLRLARDVDKKLGQLQIDATTWGIDPSRPKDEQDVGTSSMKGFDARYDEFARRWKNLPDDAKKVFTAERDYLQWAAKKSHRAGVDTALAAYDMRDIGPAQRALLYSVKDPSEYNDLIGSGKLIDIGESNEPVKAALKSMAGLTRLKGYYAPLARHGEYVSQVMPEGTKKFASQAEAETFGNKVRALSPGSRAKVSQRGGQWVADYKAEYTSFHRTPQDAEADAQKMRDMGFEVGKVTKKIYGEDNVPMTSGMKELVAEATRQINKGGSDTGTQALVENLRGAFLRMMANRSAYSASRLARKSVAGVKAEEMGRNFAQHVKSTAYHTSSLVSVFKEAEALGKVRAAARDQSSTADQKTIYRRGELVGELGKRMAQEARQYGSKVPGNALMAKLGYANYLFSPAHTAINLTQNFTTAIPRATVKFGPRAIPAFARSMKMIAGPAFRTTFLAHIKPGQLTGRNVLEAVVEAIRKDPVHGKWARGENSPLQQLMDKGVVTSTFSNELADIAKGDNPFWGRVFEYARLLPHLSDVFNRTTTAMAALELSRGDVRAAADLINETHVNYSAENMPRAFRALKQVPVFGTSVVMFKTYMQGMAHLMYSAIRDSVMGGRHVEGSFIQRRAEAAKTVAALVIGTALFTGLKGATPEIVHLAAYAYNKIFGDKDEYWSFDNATHRALGEALGAKAGDLAFSGLPHAAGVDVSSRMGFNELLFHNMPDLLDTDSDHFNKFLVDQLGTIPSLGANELIKGVGKITNGDVAGGLEAAVPIKLFQSAMSAFHEYSGGATSEDGSMMIEPGNGYAAAMQAFGFKPSELANAQEKQGVAIDYRNFVDRHKKAIVADLVNNGMDMTKIGDWNSRHPDRGDRISAKDIIILRRQKQMAEQQVRGMPGRNTTVNKLTDFGD